MSKSIRTLFCVVTIAGAGTALAQVAGRAVVPALTQDQLTASVRWANRLADEVEFFMEDVRYELQGKTQRDLYRRADALLRDTLEFRRSLRTDASRDSIYQGFQQIDRQVQDLITVANGVAANVRTVSRDLSRIRYADEQLHLALMAGDRTDARRIEAIARQATLLATEAREFALASQYAVGDDARGNQIVRWIEDFAEQARRFSRNLDRQAPLATVQRNFNELDQSWAQVVRVLNGVTPTESYYVRRRAQYVGEIYSNLHRLLELETNIPQLSALD